MILGMFQERADVSHDVLVWAAEIDMEAARIWEARGIFFLAVCTDFEERVIHRRKDEW